MFKFAVIFLIISLIAGALGFTTVSRVAKRISLVLFALFFLLFLAVVGFALLIGEAIAPSPAPAPTLVNHRAALCDISPSSPRGAQPCFAVAPVAASRYRALPVRRVTITRTGYVP